MNCKSRIYFICVMWSFVTHNNVAASQSDNTTSTISSYQNPNTSKLGIQHILSRKKRYLLFPTGSAFVATMSFAKAIALDYPLGINIVAEVDFYYPMYSSISDLFPKHKKPKPITTLKPNPIPTTRASNPIFDSIPFSYYDDDNFWRRKDSHSYSKYYNKDILPLDPNYTTWQPLKPNYKSLYRPSTNYVRKPIQNSHKTYLNDAPYPNNYQDWSRRQHESYRSRRDLYSHVEGIAEKHGFDIKTCIHRMICEGRHYLLPPGISFFQDVLRILFTLPVSNDVEDGYSRAMQATEDECLSIYSEKCPYSIIGYLIHTQQEPNK